MSTQKTGSMYVCDKHQVVLGIVGFSYTFHGCIFCPLCWHESHGYSEDEIKRIQAGSLIGLTPSQQKERPVCGVTVPEYARAHQAVTA
jgi:hypothetical protein